MRSLEASRIRWQITTKHTASLDDLKRAVRFDSDESPCVSGLRSVCWKTFLLFQTTEVSGWSRALVDSRSAYASLREHLLRYIENPDELGSALDPLDDDQHSPWNTLRQDEEIRAEIFQDIERCMPEEPYFRKPETQTMLLDILFVFCKINQDVGYRQGMHELLAPILWVVEQDAIENMPQHDQGSSSREDSLMKQTLDPLYIEHDAFTLLSLVMRSAKSFYELGEPDQKSGNSSSGPGTSQQSASPIVERSKRIHEVYLARMDPGLAKHLTNIEVLPQIFLIRWIRLLFGREFPFDELLALWDTLLAEDPGLDLVDLVCVAMILRIRWQLIDANYSTALMLLLKYPYPDAPHGPQTFVDDAIYLRNNFSAAGGAELIRKYSGKSPSVNSSVSRPATPLGQALSPRRNLLGNKPPLPSPASFLQQQGGVEALFQGAAKGLFDRGERLGINQAVRDAVGEAKKNMQGLQAARQNSEKRRKSEVMRWSLDEGRSIPASRASVTAMNARSQQLARMLGAAMADLREVSVSATADKEAYIQAMDLAIAKVEFVKIYLEDATMPLPEETSSTVCRAPANSGTAAIGKAPRLSEPTLPTATPLLTSGAGAQMPMGKAIEEGPLGNAQVPDNPMAYSGPPVAVEPSSTLAVDIPTNPAHPVSQGLSLRPRAPVPTRSSIAQSSFSFMLEPNESPGSGAKAMPPKSSSPFSKSGRRPTSGPNREKAAFLFGEEGADSISRLPLDSTEEAFNLGTIECSKPNDGGSKT